MALVRPLEDAWQPVLDAVLAELRAPRTAEVAKLAPRIQALSASYNAGRAGDAAKRGPIPLEARVAFSFARDVPKGAGAVRELVTTGALALGDAPLRVLDLGAGLGAITWGIARALAAAGARGRIEALLVDEDPHVLSAAGAIARKARTGDLGLGDVTLDVQTRVAKVGEPVPGARLFDLVVLGQVLSEMDVDLAPEARVAKHADLVRSLLDGALADGGSLVVVEPALKDRSRHLHAVRDALLAGGATVFAPCLHAATCPVLAAPGDWCHEDLAVDLPSWVTPLARAAGLRFQGLTFSYLVLRRDARTLASLLPERAPSARRLRVVSDRLVSKGKSEIWACTDAGARSRLRRLDRDATDANDAWEQLGRGDVVTLGPADDGNDERVGARAGVDVSPLGK